MMKRWFYFSIIIPIRDFIHGLSKFIDEIENEITRSFCSCEIVNPFGINEKTRSTIIVIFVDLEENNQKQRIAIIFVYIYIYKYKRFRIFVWRRDLEIKESFKITLFNYH